jgi:phosphoribosyl 1,2-cyclic phosphodiesterase
MATQKISLVFLGTRGIQASPGPHNAEFGGNCGSMIVSSKEYQFVINAGFALSHVSSSLLSTPRDHSHNWNVLLTDFQWNHIHGLPFFIPMHLKDHHIDLTCPETKDGAKSLISQCCQRNFSPFNGLGTFPAQINHCPITDKNPLIKNAWTVSSFAIKSSHFPYRPLSFKLEHESGYCLIVCTHTIPADQESDFMAFVNGADALVLSALDETLKSYEQSVFYSFHDAMTLFKKTNAEELIVQGYHPRLSDDDLIEIESKLRSTLPSTRKVCLARETHLHQWDLKIPIAPTTAKVS